jgi:hypothetical protein
MKWTLAQESHHFQDESFWGRFARKTWRADSLARRRQGDGEADVGDAALESATWRTQCVSACRTNTITGCTLSPQKIERIPDGL